MAQERDQQFHRVVLSERQTLTVTGVSEVVSLDETAVYMQTVQGGLTVHGQQLRLKNLTPDGGQLSLSGKIAALVYEEPGSKGGWFSRLLK